MAGMLRQMGEYILPELVWHGDRTQRTVYLTFDDGPTPGVTEFILEQLAAYKATAAFFCLGIQVENHRELFEQIQQAGHIVGNHAFHHIDGWRCTRKTYLDNVQQCAEVFESKFFRPPYGHIRPNSIRILKHQYHIIMWDVMPRDFDSSLSVKKMLNICREEIRPGSIIVLHDNNKAAPALQQLLPELLRFLSAESYNFGSLNDLVRS